MRSIRPLHSCRAAPSIYPSTDPFSQPSCQALASAAFEIQIPKHFELQPCSHNIIMHLNYLSINRYAYLHTQSSTYVKCVCSCPLCCYISAPTFCICVLYSFYCQHLVWAFFRACICFVAAKALSIFIRLRISSASFALLGRIIKTYTHTYLCAYKCYFTPWSVAVYEPFANGHDISAYLLVCSTSGTNSLLVIEF